MTAERVKVQKILVVDDNADNRYAALAFFQQNFLGEMKSGSLKVDFASDADQARIALSATPTLKVAPYDIVLTDLEMENPDSGYTVAKMAFRHGALPLIVTGRDYQMQDTGIRDLTTHGPKTYMLPTGDVIPGKKDRPDVWKEIYGNALKCLNENDRLLFNALRRSLKYDPDGYSTRGKNGMKVFSYFLEPNAPVEIN